MANLNWMRIPSELRSLSRWAVATLEIQADGKPDKSPRNPYTGHRLSTTDPEGWVTFDEVLNSQYAAIGCCLVAGGGICLIDLDYTTDPVNLQRQIKIFETLDTYAERSTSGNGVHLIALATVGGGKNLDDVEIYDQERFVICTGDVVKNVPVTNQQHWVDMLVEEMGGVNNEADLPYSEHERMSDEEILTKLRSAANAEKFSYLFDRAPLPGDNWSQLDAQLAQFIAFYTRNHEQALRLFRRSKLYRPNSKGKSPEHYERYYLLARTFAKAWGYEKQKDADVELGAQIAQQLLKQKKFDRVSFPPGLVGEVADFIYSSSQRPVPEIALAGALTFCAGIFGRQYNISHTGLNLYVVLVANTGRGKEGAVTGINALVKSVQMVTPNITDFVGPARIASGQALVRSVSKNPCQFSFIGEFGETLNQITNKKSNAADKATRQVLLDLFGKSGQSQTLQSMIYSDTDKNTKAVDSPAYTFMGDVTPSGYFDEIRDSMISGGLIPRFLVIEYSGPRVQRNVNTNLMPGVELRDRVSACISSVLSMRLNNIVVDVATTPEAKAMLDAFDAECDHQINDDKNLAEIWNRAHLKALRIAALVAVGRNHLNPVLEESDAQWAIDLLRLEARSYQDRIETGTISSGTGEGDVAQAVKDYLTMTEDTKRGYKIPKQAIELGWIPYTFFRRRLRTKSFYAEHPRGVTAAIKQALADAIDLGILQKLSDEQIGKQNASNASRAGRPLSGEFFIPGEHAN